MRHCEELPPAGSSGTAASAGCDREIARGEIGSCERPRWRWEPRDSGSQEPDVSSGDETAAGGFDRRRVSAKPPPRELACNHPSRGDRGSQRLPAPVAPSELAPGELIRPGLGLGTGGCKTPARVAAPEFVGTAVRLRRARCCVA